MSKNVRYNELRHWQVNASIMLTYPLDEVLASLRMSGTFYCTASYAVPWACSLPPTGGEARFHIITRGHVCLEGPGIEPRRLNEGDLVLLPRGAGHNLADDPATPLLRDEEIRGEFISQTYARFRYGARDDAQLVCVKARFDDPVSTRLISLLPSIIHVPSNDARTLREIGTTVDQIAREARVQRSGTETIISRLADVLILQTIRWWIEHEPSCRVGWLGAIRDPQVGPVIMLIHEDPARSWTLDELARKAAMSRSALAARFKELVGEPVMQYLTRWRMHLALLSLRQGKVDIGRLAEQIGYQSESAFNRAFKRYVGVPPGTARHDASTLSAWVPTNPPGAVPSQTDSGPPLV